MGGKSAKSAEKPVVEPKPLPEGFNDAVAFVICERIALGESLREICRDEEMPSQASVYRWLLREEPELVAFRESYTRAREAQADSLFEEIQEIADDGRNDWMERRRQDGSTEEAFNGEHVQRSKLRIDARKWMAGKLRPRKYGEKIEVEHSGQVGTTPTLSDDEIKNLLADHLAEALGRLPAITDVQPPEATRH